MKIFDSKIIVLAACIFFLQTPSSFANGLMNNSASGYVDGDIIQSTNNGDSSEINVGSIISKNGARATGITTVGYVSGDIVVHGKTKLNIATVVVR